jgi:hypothetical protein
LSASAIAVRNSPIVEPRSKLIEQPPNLVKHEIDAAGDAVEVVVFPHHR